MINQVHLFFSKMTLRQMMTLAITIVSISFTGAFVLFVIMARKNARETATIVAQNAIEHTISKINRGFNSVEADIDKAAWKVVAHLDQPQYMYTISRELIENNEHVYGGAVAFEYNYYESEGRFFSPYCWRDGDSISSKQLGTIEYEYHYMDWYQIPKLLRRSYWCEPYYDEGGGEHIMTTFSRPLFDKRDNMYGVVTADVSLDWLKNVVNGAMPFKGSYPLLLGRGCEFIVCPDSAAVLNETIFSETFGCDDEDVLEPLRKMAADIQEDKSDYVVMDREGTTYYIYYSEMSKTEWVVAICCPEKEIYAEANSLIKTVGIAFFSILVLLLVLHTRIVKSMSRRKHKEEQ